MKYDVIVAGGGFTGCCAAVAAARRGLSVLLVEKGGALGGAAVNCLVNPFMPNAALIDGVLTELSQGMYTEIKSRLAGKRALTHNIFSEEALKIALDEFVIEAGVNLLFHTRFIDVVKDGENIRALKLANKAGAREYAAKYFIDCTGDADIAVAAGCPYRLGRASDNLCQPMTLCFRVCNVDMEAFERSKSEINAKYQHLQRAGKITNPREDVLWFYTTIPGVIHFNSTRVVKLNPVDPFDISKAEIEGRRQARELFDFLKANIGGFENADIIMTAPEIGVRESRMIDGLFTLDAEEMKKCPRYADSIAAGNYDIDIHNPEGGGTSHYYFPQGQYYTIPYRALIPRGVNNLLVAGRTISATHEAQASIRIMPICITLGEAAGVAASVARADNADFASADISIIQARLRENGAFLGI